jgi:transcription elongation factor GreA
MTPSRGEADEIFLTQAGRQLLLDRARELRNRADALIGSLEDQAGEPWTVDERERALSELDRLTSALATARAVEELPGDPRVVLLGDVVDLRLSDGTAERHIVVHPVEAPIDDARISTESPLGVALLGRHVGEDVEVRAPSGSYRCTIVSAERETTG